MRSTRAALAALLIAIAIAYALGFATAKRRWFPHDRAIGVWHRLTDAREDGTRQRHRPTAPITTTFLSLAVEEIPAPNGEAGGAVTSLGADTVVLTRRGEVRVLEDGRLRVTGARLPDNGLAEYEGAAEARQFAHLWHRTDRLRYNDLLAYSTPQGQHGVLLSFTQWHDDRRCFTSTLARLSLPRAVRGAADLPGDAGSWKTIFESHPCLPLKETARALDGHVAGGRLLYDGRERVLMSVGDYHWDGVFGPKRLAQAEDNDYGKILSIDLSDGKSRHFSIGNRNVQGMTLDRAGNLWATEHGPRGGDELNIVRNGENYGWPTETLGTAYTGLPWPSGGAPGRHEAHTAPVYAWLPSPGVSSLTYLERFHPAWNGDLIAASLTGQSLFRLRVREERVVFAERIHIGRRIRDLHPDRGGSLLVWTDESVLLRLTPRASGMALEHIRAIARTSPYRRDYVDRISSAVAECAECHALEGNAHASAPSLAGLFGRAIASTAYRNYSPALRAVEGTWTQARIAQFLRDPQAFAPGTHMPDPNLGDDETAATIAQLFMRLGRDL